MKNRRNYYRILQIQPDAPPAVIKASYFAHLRDLKLHPDCGGNHWNATVLNEAYGVLNDVNKRAIYDRKLFNYYTKKVFLGKTPGKTPFVSVFCPVCKRPISRNNPLEKSCPHCQNIGTSTNKKNMNDGYIRSVIRFRRMGKVNYFISCSQIGKEAKLIDISTRGMRFACERRLDVGTAIKIVNSLGTAVAKVVNVQENELNGKKYYFVGTRFQSADFFSQKGSFYSASA